ncbi:MAG: phage holin family protein [Proteobacteria bacterium]|nr:phage holin family protein [Pseudomonadota bacterium]
MAEQEGAARGGLLYSVRHLASSLLAAAQTRLEILATEIEEERVRLEQMLLVALGAVFCLGMGVILSVGFIVVFFWDTHRLAAVGGLAAGFLGAGALLGFVLRDKAKSRPKLFAATRGELAKDRAALREPQA